MFTRFEFAMDTESVTSLKEVLRVLDKLEELQSFTTVSGLLHDLKETISHYETIKDDILMEISNELGLQFEATIKNKL